MSRYVMAVLFVALCARGAWAFDVSAYAESSVLAKGRWVKVSVSSTGLHLITNADLRSWGFTDPSAVRIHGYGGNRLSDLLSLSNYRDDLPPVQSVVTARGVVFYAVGPESFQTAPRTNRKQWERSINPYTTLCYYYVTADPETATRDIPKEGVAMAADAKPRATTFTATLHHENDLITVKETGHSLFGEDMRFTQSRTFKFSMPDRVDTAAVWIQCRMFAHSPDAPTNVTYTANGTALPVASSDAIRYIPSSSDYAYVYGDTCLSQKSVKLSGETLNLGISVKNSGTLRLCHLDRIDINYTRRLNLPAAGVLAFSTDSVSAGIEAGARASSLRVWDVTNPLSISEMNATISGSMVKWAGEYHGRRNYVAWHDNATLPSPVFAANVTNQNLHSLATPDMLIITLPGLRAQAERIAALHRNSADSLSVAVVTASEVYNEFSSGMPDPGAFRRMLKMLRDRNPRLAYCLLMGRPTFDHRRLTADWRNSRIETLPIWQTDNAINDNGSYCSDDILAMLDDNTGDRTATTPLTIAIGRIPVSTNAEAAPYVDKLAEYMTSTAAGPWTTAMLTVADDQDSGNHMLQAETMANNMLATENGPHIINNKVYIDAYPKRDGRVPIARDMMFSKLDEGVMWWNYIGHASHTSWTHENQLTIKDIDNLYYRNLPVLYAATCDFGRWDSSETCGAETMLLKEGGGVIAAVTATRPVYISANGNLTASLGNVIMRPGSDGRPMTLGEIIRNAKNFAFTDKAVNSINDSNRLRYVLMGDPAMRIAFPDNRVKINTINGVNPDDPNADAIIMAHQHAVVEGTVNDPSGRVMTEFTGMASITINDAEFSTTTEGRGDDTNPGKEVTYEQHGSLLYSGRFPVTEGRFSATLPMPAETAQNFRNATMNIVAESADGRRASGATRNFFVYGYDESAPVDSVPPVIDYAYLNHESFVNGDIVNESPLLIASVRDNVGLNLSSAGIGHSMFMQLDGSKSITDVAQYYTPASDGTPSGTILYPLEGLAEGPHSLMLRVWDTSGNASTASLDFYVKPGIAPRIFDVYTDANPATDEARFFIKHNRPDALITVTVEVYNLRGRLEWSNTITGRSEMFVTSPMVWNLNNAGGRRVNRGIYLYRATVTTDGINTTSATRRLAVTGR